MAVLLLFTARRWLLILAALLPARNRPPVPPEPAPVLLLVPFRNEAQALPGLLSTLARLDYPAGRLEIVLIDDGSTDGGDRPARDWAAQAPNRHLLSLSPNRGKAGALNAALAHFPFGQIVAVYDADERPRPDALRELVRPFGQAGVGAASGRRAASNALASPAAAYSAVEGLVHQLVTMRAKDRLALAPAVLGANCAYRRAALAEVGNFKPGALLEDSDLTLKLARAGWQTRFVPGAVSDSAVPETVAGYWRQHTRWARGFSEVARVQAGPLWRDRRLPLALRLELLLFSLGYLDRLALLAGGALLALLGRAGRPLAGTMALSLLTPLVQAVAALAIGRQPPALWLRLAWLPLFFGLDLAMAAVSFWAALRQSPQVWEERRAHR